MPKKLYYCSIMLLSHYGNSYEWTKSINRQRLKLRDENNFTDFQRKMQSVMK